MINPRPKTESSEVTLPVHVNHSMIEFKWGFGIYDENFLMLFNLYLECDYLLSIDHIWNCCDFLFSQYCLMTIVIRSYFRHKPMELTLVRAKGRSDRGSVTCVDLCNSLPNRHMLIWNSYGFTKKVVTYASSRLTSLVHSDYWHTLLLFCI